MKNNIKGFGKSIHDPNSLPQRNDTSALWCPVNDNHISLCGAVERCGLVIPVSQVQHSGIAQAELGAGAAPGPGVSLDFFCQYIIE